MRLLRIVALLVFALSCASAATLVSKATGNFTAAGTWGVGEAGAGAIQTTRSANTNTTTAYVYSSAFTCTNLDVVDGIVVFGRQLTVTGTVSVALSDDNGVTATRELAVNATDLNTSDSPHFFLFGSTLTCDGGADYKVGIKGSSAGNANFYRDGTAGNWFRIPRTTTTAAPGAADLLYVNGELTGAATGNSFTVTMDNTAATTFGTVAATASLAIGTRGTMTWGVAAATAYRLDIAGIVSVFGGGTYNQGTSGARPPSNSSVKLNWDLTTNVDSGFQCEAGGTCNVYGATVTTTQTLLNTDEAAGQTVLGVAAQLPATGEIAIAPTSRTASEAEKRTISTSDATTVTVTAGLTNAHSGTSPTQAEVVYLTRNAVIQGESDTLQGYVRCATTAVCNFDYVEFYRLGSATSQKRGIDALTTTGSLLISNSALHDFVVTSSIGLYVSSGSSNNVTFTNNVGYDAGMVFFFIEGTTGTNWSATGNVVVSNRNANASPYYLADLGGTFSNNTAAGSSSVGFDFRETVSGITLLGLTAHSNTSVGARWIGTLSNSTLDTWKFWRHNAQGVGTFTNEFNNLVIKDSTFFGNTTQHLDMDDAKGITILNCTFAGDTTFSTLQAFGPNTGSQAYRMRIVNSTFGVASGIFVAHTTADIILSTAYYDLIFDNSLLASATPFTPLTTALALQGSFLKFQKYNQVAADHRSYFRYGTVFIDTTTVRGSLPSQRVTPNSASVKLESGPWRVPVLSGATVPASAWVRKSTAADSCGANYNGAELRLIVRRNSAAGIAVDTVLDTSTVAIGNWEQLSATTAAVADDGALEFLVDGDGTAGCFYVESGPYWFEGLPNPSGVGGGGAPAGGGGGASSFVARSFGPRVRP